MKPWKLQRCPLWLLLVAVGLSGLTLLASAWTWWCPLLGVLLGWYGPQFYLLWRQRR